MKSIITYTAVFGFAFLLSACKYNKGENSQLNKTTTTDSIQPPKAISVNYYIDSIKNDSALTLYHAKYSKEQQEIIGALNRIDPQRIRVGKKIVLPDTMLPDILLFTPFPVEIDFFASIPKLILVQQRIQAIAIYENGKLIRWGPCSSGRKSKPTPNGLFHTNFKKKLKISTVDGDWKMPYYFNIANFDGIGLHQYELPGYPASHSCIRLFKKDAIFIFNWADTWEVSEDGATVTKKGTPVIVFGDYDFAGTPPWKEVVNQKEILKLNDAELKTLEEYTGKINAYV